MNSTTHDSADEATEVEGVSIAALPKVSLHDHLDGGLRPETILELAAEIGLELPASDPDALGRWFFEAASAGNLVDYLQTFVYTVAVMQTAPNLTRVAREFVQDLASDGVLYGEVRWAPEQHLEAGLTLDEAVEAVQAGLEQGVADAEDEGHEIRVGQLLTTLRHADHAAEIAELALRQRNAGVVGFDLAGPELGFPPSRFRETFDTLAGAFLPVTVHAGESDSVDSIRSALLDGRALRLGHGAQLADDISIHSTDDNATYVVLGEVAQWVKDRRIALELSPTSNLQTGAVAAYGPTLAEHPIDLFAQLGFRVTVNTDNRLMSDTTLTRELGRLVDAFGYGLDDLERFQLNAAEAAFLPSEDRDALAAAIEEGFGAL